MTTSTNAEAALLESLAARSRASADAAACRDALVMQHEQTIELLQSQLECARADLAAAHARADGLAAALRDQVAAYVLAVERPDAPPARPSLPVFDAASLIPALRADLRAELEASHESQLHKAELHADAHKQETGALQEVVKVLQSDGVVHAAEKRGLREEIARLKVENATLKALVPISAQRHVQ